MRKLFVTTAAALVLIAAAGSATAETSQGAWTNGYDATRGFATATQSEPDGDVTAAFACRPPDGELIIYDYTLRGGGTMTFRVGDYTMSAEAKRERGPHGRAVVARLAQSPPVLAAAARPDATLTLEAGGRSHTLARGAGMEMLQVANSCWVR